MKKIIIKNKNGIQTHGAEMENPTEWIANCVSNNLWGKPEQIELDENGNPTGVIIPAEYTIEITDITSQFQQEQINKESQEYLNSTDWYIIREMDAGIPCPVEIKTLRANARAAIIK
jgi:hypothetical protein